MVQTLNSTRHHQQHQKIYTANSGPKRKNDESKGIEGYYITRMPSWTFQKQKRKRDTKMFGGEMKRQTIL